MNQPDTSAQDEEAAELHTQFEQTQQQIQEKRTQLQNLELSFLRSNGAPQMVGNTNPITSTGGYANPITPVVKN